MTKSFRGFTLVELLIIISTIGILVTIGVVGWGATTTWSKNKTRTAELIQWKSTFELYKSRFQSYPVPDNILTPYCLGDNFPSNKCGNTSIGSYSPSSDLNTMIARVSKIPVYDHPLVKNAYVGPFVTYNLVTNKATITGVFDGSGSGACPPEAPYDTLRNTPAVAGVAYCSITLNL